MCESGIGRGDGCFIAYNKGSPRVTAIVPASLRTTTLTSMDIFDKLSTFIETDNIDGNEILYEECKKDISIGTLPRLSNFEVDKLARKQ